MIGKYKHIGCWKDKEGDRAIPTIEGHHDSLVDDYKTRQDPVEKCYQAAKKQGESTHCYYYGLRKKFEVRKKIFIHNTANFTRNKKHSGSKV